MIKQLVRDKIDEIFLELQEANGIIDGGISPLDAVELEQIEETLAELIEKITDYQPKEINCDNFAPSWYVYTDENGECHDVVYGYDDINAFFADVSHRIAFDDCTDETVHKIYYKGKEIQYVGWQSGMKFEYKDLDGDTVWVGVFEHWDH
jgi:hypothetical protein